jgi:hypothetical protein
MSILSSLLGLDSSSNANKAQGQANQLYGQLGQIGQQNATAYNQVPGAIDSYASNVNNNPLLSLFQQGTSNSPLVQSFGQAYGLNVPGSNQGQPGGSATAPGSTPTGGASQGQSLLPQDAYGLTQGQQIELNTQLNTLSQAQQNAVSQYQSSFAQRGGDPSQMAAGVAAINEQFAALSEQTKGSFAQNALTQRQTGLNTLLQGGEAAQSQQNAGNLGVADLLMQLGSQGAGQIGQAAGASQANANTQQSQSNADMGGLLNLITLGLSGGFSGLGGGGGSSNASFPATVATNSQYGI